jgi:hypothetical protein
MMRLAPDFGSDQELADSHGETAARESAWHVPDKIVAMVPWEATLVAGIAGGVIGVGGTYLGAWLTGRTQTANLKLSIDAENKRNRLAEKRRIYASCLASYEPMTRQAIVFWIANDEARSLGEPSPSTTELLAVGSAMYVAVNELRLIEVFSATFS